MARTRNFFIQPRVDGVIQLVEFAGEEVIGAFHNNKMIFARQRGDERFDFLGGAESVFAAVDEKLRLVALAQKGKIGAVSGNAQADQVSDSSIFASDTQSHQ